LFNEYDFSFNDSKSSNYSQNANLKMRVFYMRNLYDDISDESYEFFSNTFNYFIRSNSSSIKNKIIDENIKKEIRKIFQNNNFNKLFDHNYVYIKPEYFDDLFLSQHIINVTDEDLYNKSKIFKFKLKKI